jgi:phosphoglycolate phosphatase (TIGR01487 family)
MAFKALATDYDGTLAHHGTVEPTTLDAIGKLRAAGMKTLLVTGREIPDLQSVFSEFGIFDLIVAENGALLYWPATAKQELIAPTPPREFAEYLRRNGVKELSIGRTIVATMEIYSDTVQKGIQALNLPLDVILNKGSLMVLPRGIHKGFGLKAALPRLDLQPADVVAVGDAENDLTFLREAGYGVAVNNALSQLKDVADWVTPSGHGNGVRELIEALLRDELPARRQTHS